MKKKSVIICVVLVVIVVLYFAFLLMRYQTKFPPMQLSQNKEIVGNLGGVKVRIPNHLSLFIKYEEDPSKFIGAVTKTQKSDFDAVINGFAFEVRYPDMAEDIPEHFADKRASSMFTTMWMRVLINNGEHWGPKEFSYLENEKRDIGIGVKFLGEKYFYEQLKEKQYDLYVHLPRGFDTSRDQEPKDQYSIYFYDNFYYHLNEEGKVDTFIKCPNSKFESATCQHFFNLSPRMWIKVEVAYRKALLPHWREIQEKVASKILGFAVDGK
jgi:hypothetical protein